MGANSETHYAVAFPVTFDEPSTEPFNPTPSMLSLELSPVPENSALLSVLMTCASARAETPLQYPDGGRRLVVYDVAWWLMSCPSLLARMESQWQLARHCGSTNLLIVHNHTEIENVGDQGAQMRALASAVLANAESRIIYRQEADQLGATARMFGVTDTEQRLYRLPRSGKGYGNSRNAALRCGTTSTLRALTL